MRERRGIENSAEEKVSYRLGRTGYGAGNRRGGIRRADERERGRGGKSARARAPSARRAVRLGNQYPGQPPYIRREISISGFISLILLISFFFYSLSFSTPGPTNFSSFFGSSSRGCCIYCEFLRAKKFGLLCI